MKKGMGFLGSLVHTLDKREIVIAKRHENSCLCFERTDILTTSRLACGKLHEIAFETCLHWSKIAILVGWWHAHGRINRRWRGWPVWSASGTRIVLAPAPTETNTRVANRITLHLVDSHLSCMTLDELDEATAFSRGDLDVGDFAEALEERAQLILCNVSRKSSNKNSGIVRIGKLIHGLLLLLLTIKGHWRGSHGGWVHRATRARHSHSARAARAALVLWGCRRNAHGSVSTVYTLHFAEGSLLIDFI
jgi:hypothetical protein